MPGITPALNLQQHYVLETSGVLIVRQVPPASPGLRNVRLTPHNEINMTKFHSFLLLSFTLTASFALSGCGQDFQKPVVPVTGFVRVDGDLVTEGYIVLTPIPGSDANPLNSGKSASGTISSDGTFEMTTYETGDGAIIGKHVAHFFRPDPEDDEQIVEEKYIPGGKEVELEVIDGENKFDIHLHAKGPAEVIQSGS
ncbi:hypothetical protein MalM14_07270 [Gimesia chilikensis]|nr:hypothetical protein MalM14_07270 [Gimesia chilikensis]